MDIDDHRRLVKKAKKLADIQSNKAARELLGDRNALVKAIEAKRLKDRYKLKKGA